MELISLNNGSHLLMFDNGQEILFSNGEPVAGCLRNGDYFVSDMQPTAEIRTHIIEYIKKNPFFILREVAVKSIGELT